MIDGLKTVRTIQSNERYDAYEAELGGQKVFAKCAKSAKTNELLVGLPKNSEMINVLGEKTSFKFRAPKVLAQADEWIVTEWINGQPLGTQMDTEPNDVADILVSFFEVFDKVPVANEGFRQIFTTSGLAGRM